VIRGGSGNDILTPGAGSDDVDGGTGNDTVFDDDFVNFDVHRGGLGVDAIDYSRVAFSNGLVTINLAAGLAAVTGGNTEQILGFVNVFGSGGGETIIGTTGANRIWGLAGADLLRGGAGADIFDFFSLTHSNGAALDRIQATGGATAFQGAGVAGGDVIAVTGIDANAGVAGNQNFVFGGTGVGRLSCVNLGTSTLVRGNVDGDADFEFQCLIEDGAVLASAYRVGDFLL
jgi:Ca2+-binding RTX toxin-like protein